MFVVHPLVKDVGVFGATIVIVCVPPAVALPDFDPKLNVMFELEIAFNIMVLPGIAESVSDVVSQK